MAQNRTGIGNGETDSTASERRRAEHNPTTERVAARAHDTIDRAAEAADRAEAQVREAAARTARQARDMQERALDTADQSMRRVRSYVEENPIMSAGIAFAAGVILSSLLRR